MTAHLTDDAAMRIALDLARSGLGRTWPNPSVGCVIVRDGQCIASARTADHGRPHAEAQALAQAGAAAHGATAYVTLEPCHTHGHTGPCTQAMIDAGLARVVIACRDPFQQRSGGDQGLNALRAAGITVEFGLLGHHAMQINEGFFSKVQRGRPWIAAKIATSMDGKIASAQGHSQWITGPEARAYGHRLRAQHDAIITGIGTVIADNPHLTVRHGNSDGWQPVRIVLDPRLRLPDQSALVQTARENPVWVLTRDTQSDRANFLHAQGVRVMKWDDDWPAVLCREGLTRLLVEAGPRTLSPLMRGGRIDRLYWFQAPILLGAGGLNAFDATLGPDDLNSLPRWQHEEQHVIGPDLLNVFQIHPSCAKAT